MTQSKCHGPSAASGRTHDAFDEKGCIVSHPEDFDAAEIREPLDFRDDKILSNAMRVRARLGLIERTYKQPRVVTEIRLLDEVIEELMPRV